MNKDITDRNYGRVLIMHSINSVAGGLIGIFVPIYLYQLGFSFVQIMLYLIINHGFMLAMMFVAVSVSNKFGLLTTMKVRFVFLALYFAALYALPHYTGMFLFVATALLRGTENAFYWQPFNVFMVRNTKPETMGTAFSKFLAYPKIIGIFTPLLGAGIIVFFSFPVLILVSGILFVISIIPIAHLSSEKTSFKFNWSIVKKIYRKNKDFVFPEIIDNLAQDAGIIWTLFIYLQLIDVFQIGIIGTIASVSSILFTLTLGKIADRSDKKKMLQLGIVCVIAVWTFNAAIAQFSSDTAWLFYVSSLLMAFLLKIFFVPYASLMFNRAREYDAQFLVLREIPTVFGRILLFIVAILLHDNLPLLFLLVGLSFIYFFFFKPRIKTN